MIVTKMNFFWKHYCSKLSIYQQFEELLKYLTNRTFLEHTCPYKSPKWTYADSWKESQRLGTAFFALFMCFLVWLSNNYVRGFAFLLATSSLPNQYNLGKTFTRTSFLSASRSCTSFWNGDVPCRCSLLIAALCIALFAFSIACVMLWTHGLEWQVQSPLAGFVVLWEQQGTQDIPSFLT